MTIREIWRRFIDRKRCAYSDCSHPEARSDEQVTCPQCRDYLALPPIGIGLSGRI